MRPTPSSLPARPSSVPWTSSSTARGVQHVAPVEAFPDDRWDEIIALNLTAAFCAARAAIPAMRRHGFGRIVNIASVHGLVASEGTSAHVTAKHRLRGLP